MREDILYVILIHNSCGYNDFRFEYAEKARRRQIFQHIDRQAAIKIIQRNGFTPDLSRKHNIVGQDPDKNGDKHTEPYGKDYLKRIYAVWFNILRIIMTRLYVFLRFRV